MSRIWGCQSFRFLGFRVLELRFRVLGFRVLGFRVLGFRVQSFRALGLEFWGFTGLVYGLGFREFQSFRFRVLGFQSFRFLGFRVQSFRDLGFSGLGFRVSELQAFRVWFRVQSFRALGFPKPSKQVKYWPKTYERLFIVLHTCGSRLGLSFWAGHLLRQGLH